MTNKLVGQFYERRGDDHFTVNTSQNGDVVQIVQRDAIRLSWPSINFWTESTPEMIRLIEKAAGIEPEYEYSIKVVYPSGNTDVYQDWSNLEHIKSKLEWFSSDVARWRLKNEGCTYSLVRRRKAGPEEDVE